MEANWEAMRVNRYSSLDTDGLTQLAPDMRWSNEDLFAFLADLRQLGQRGAPIASPSHPSRSRRPDGKAWHIGNASVDGADRGGWLIGRFIDDGADSGG